MASKLKYNFAVIHCSGVEIGIPGTGGYSMKFTSTLSVENYLPAGGTPSALTCDRINPASSTSGVFGGQAD